jgi:hypothetical protein
VTAPLLERLPAVRMNKALKYMCSRPAKRLVTK